jgi:hypothetical protein
MVLFDTILEILNCYDVGWIQDSDDRYNYPSFISKMCGTLNKLLENQDFLNKHGASIIMKKINESEVDVTCESLIWKLYEKEKISDELKEKITKLQKFECIKIFGTQYAGNWRYLYGTYVTEDPYHLYVKIDELNKKYEICDLVEENME